MQGAVMANIVVADKQSTQLTQNAWGDVTLQNPSLVQMPVSPNQVATVTRKGQDLIVTLKSGEQVTVGNFFAVNPEGVASDMVFVGEDGTLWHAVYDADAFTGLPSRTWPPSMSSWPMSAWSATPRPPLRSPA